MMVNKIRNGAVIFCAACALLSASCSPGGADGNNQFEVIQQKVTRGEPLTKQEQEAFDNLNKTNPGHTVQEGAPK